MTTQYVGQFRRREIAQAGSIPAEDVVGDEMTVERSVIDIDRSQVGKKERGRIVELGSNPEDDGLGPADDPR